MLSKRLRRVWRGIKRQQVKNLLALTFVTCSFFILGLTYLKDCRLFAFSSECEPEYLSIKLNDSFLHYGHPVISQTGNLSGSRKMLHQNPKKLAQDVWKDSDNIVEESLELTLDAVFEERRDAAGRTCSIMLNEAIEKERALAKEMKRKRTHVSFSVGPTTTDPEDTKFDADKVENGSIKLRRAGRILDLKNITALGKPRYFQAQVKFFQNRWVHYHRIIKSSKGPVYNKVVEIQWCPVFKAASTPWLAVFTKLSKGLTNRTEAAIKRGKMGFLELARSYRLLTPRRYDKEIHPVRTKMVVVRHPFKRLLSGYKDKIERVKGRLYYYNKYSTKILRKFRSSKPSQLQLMSKDKDFLLKIPTFQEFVKFVLSTQPKSLDEHWRPMFLDCNPCHKKFDFILKVETLDQDMKKVLQYLHLNETDPQYKDLIDVWTRWNNPSNTGFKKHPRNESFYFSQLTKNDMSMLYEVYEPDFRLFGYSPEYYFSMVSKSSGES